ncbi:hemicentin-2-like isoform X2 [Mizuhopecten yessoensis]|uniref:hemicentin-2-like isoform X2 n=1 Tax=Mizuhopecten yessoensis TaxID=6573 RepID=UPI000B45988C|nr:hemicentin-2-like isoform X2 [Mizuhopecten yessoensis]
MLEGDTMQNVLCKADCNPACHVTWTRNSDHVSGDGTLSLDGPKTISLSPPGDVSVQEEERIDVRCQASCSPSCAIYWTGPTTTYQAGRRGPNLLIRHADKTYRGVYVCVASNDYGNISTSLRVNVNYAGSDIKLVPNDTHYSDKEGTVLPDIRCVAECNPACEMSWYHDRTGRLVEGSTLSLKNMKRSKDGNYMCNATNNLGTQTLSLTVVSLFPPEVLRKDLLNTSYDVDEWDSVFSSISVDASPLPQADLVHVGVDQQEATNVVLQSLRQPVSYRTEFSYSIRNITYSDVGHYTLTVSNSQGDFTYKFSINIIHEDCQPGKRGKKCELDCSTKCKDLFCERDTGFCSECRDGLYGYQCEKTCPDGCGSNKCRRSDGKCDDEEFTESVPVIAGLASVAALFLVMSIAFIVNMLRKRIAAKRQIQEEHYCSIDPAGQEVPNTYEMIVTDRTPS